MSENYQCEGNKNLMLWCCYSIRNNKHCHKCPQFKEMWERRLADNNFTYCHLYESKKMKDCEGTHFNEETGRYECKYFPNWGDCPYKTPNDLYKNRTKV